nr:LOW QUALITY PROTEIN: uncharacterized protein LOC119165105 [Rhipicephalus microplus]
MSEEDLCISCQKTVPCDGRFMKCLECKYFYHLGSSCSGIAPNTFTTMGQPKRDYRAVKLKLHAFSATDVVAVHRFPGKQDSSPTVLVRFCNVAMRQKWYNKRGKLQELYLTKVLPKLFFNDNLTKLNRHLFWLARSAGKQNNYKFIWVTAGKLFAKKDEDAPLNRIINDGDIEKIK